MAMDKFAVARNIESLLDKHKMHGSQLAERLGVTCNAVSNWRTGLRQPSAYAVYRMAKVFGCTMEDIMKGVEVEDV